MSRTRIQNTNRLALTSWQTASPDTFKLAQNRVIETWIGQLQGQRVFPVNASPHGISGLPVGQAFGKLQQGRQRKPCGRFGRLTASRKQSRELLILKQRAEGIRQVHR